MYEYNWNQWVLFFFLYCFIGWVWECCYVSAKKRKWVNRGFLHGPLLPIYGFGAIAVLLLTLPVKESSGAVACLGAFGATVLEYVTGAVMERLFHVRYWDYSNQKCNIHGYICLTSTIAWGFFSVILVKYVHQYIVRLVCFVPEIWMILLDLILAAALIADTIVSAREAFDLKAIILAEKELALITQSLALVKQNIEENSARLRESFGESTEKLRESLGESTEKLRESLGGSTEKLRESLGGSTEKLRESLGGSTEKLRESLGGSTEKIRESLGESKEKLQHLQLELEQRLEFLRKGSERRLRSAGRILKRNPTSTYQRKRITLEGLKEKLEKWNNKD